MIDGLVMAARKRVPNSLRRMVRLANCLRSNYVMSPFLPDHCFTGALFLPSRKALVESLPKGGRVLELGTDRGDFADVILKNCAPLVLEVIDIDFSRFNPALRSQANLTCHEGRGLELMKKMEANSFDWIYIDASHAYEDVMADAQSAMRILKPGGLLIFNDFAHIDGYLGRYGVHRAVSEFILKYSLQIYALSYDPNGLYDIAVKKPE